MSKFFFHWLLIINLIQLYYSYTIEPITFESLDNTFRLSIPNDPDIKWVAFNVNINKEFRSFESGQLTGLANMPQNERWSYEFNRNLQDSDIIYIWLAVQHNRLVFRDMKDPISVGAFRSGNKNFIITTTPRTTTTETVTEETSTIKKPIDATKICSTSITELQNPRNFCKGDLIFEDNFNIFNEEYWTNEVLIPPTTNDAEFVLYNGTFGIEGGLLKINANLNDRNIKKDSIDLGERCTSFDIENECRLEPKGNLYLPPVITGRINTKNYFNFKYGRVEVRAKLPKGDWLFPLILLEPTAKQYGDYFKSGEMRIAYARGNKQLQWQNRKEKNIDGERLFGGVILAKNPNLRHQFMKDVTVSEVNGRQEHFGDNFHIYSLTWTPDQLILAVDGYEYGKIKADFKKSVNEEVWNRGENNAPLDQMFYITLGLSAGGHGDFPDDLNGKPWENTSPKAMLHFYNSRSTWFSTWSHSSLEVDYVRVYAV